MIIGILKSGGYLSFLALGALGQLGFADSTIPPASAPLSAALETIRTKYNFPALAGAIVTTNGIVEQAGVGVRKRGTDVTVAIGDKWNLGSDSKLIAALLIGTYVADGKLKWSTPIAPFFPELAAQIPISNRDITIGDVLSHSAGLQGDLDRAARQACPHFYPRLFTG